MPSEIPTGHAVASVQPEIRCPNCGTECAEHIVFWILDESWERRTIKWSADAQGAVSAEAGEYDGDGEVVGTKESELECRLCHYKSSAEAEFVKGSPGHTRKIREKAITALGKTILYLVDDNAPADAVDLEGEKVVGDPNLLGEVVDAFPNTSISELVAAMVGGIREAKAAEADDEALHGPRRAMDEANAEARGRP